MSIKHIVLMLLAVLGASQAAAQAEDGKFTIAVVPDTQYYTDYRHQTEEGLPFDARELFFDQMQYIAANAESEGGDIAFATALGDVWQHASQRMTPAYARSEEHTSELQSLMRISSAVFRLKKQNNATLLS